MTKQHLLPLLLITSLFIAACTAGAPQQEKAAAEGTPAGAEPQAQLETHTVEITASGFEPKTLEIKQGDTVMWMNNDAESSWPASAVHPTHRMYPGSDIEKCGTAAEQDIFDACHGLEQGESYSFTFNEAGTWRYHDHLRTGMSGSITVE